MKIHPNRFHCLSLLIIAILGTFAVALPSFARIRTSVTYSSFVNPESTTAIAAVFQRGGIFTIAGGVVLQGRAQFYLEEGANEQSISADALGLTIDPKGAVFINYQDRAYQLEMHKGLACPLGKFVTRGGIIAYTIPPGNRDEAPQTRRSRMARAGLVNEGNEGVAQEFAETGFRGLFEEADFADDEPLPSDLETRIITKINNALGPNRTSDAGGSYVNTDDQVTYQVYLVAQARRVDITGVPLRYYWRYASDGSALITSVTALSQDWSEGQALTDFSEPNDGATQYDIVSMYQAAGVFRQLREVNSSKFTRFVSTACAH